MKLRESSASSKADYDRLGERRVWYWRGWRVRYTHVVSSAASESNSTEQAMPLLLLHGAGSSLVQWRESLSALAQDRPVYALDFVGFGDSEKIAVAFSTDLWVAQVAAFWQTFLRQPMLLIGHSLGASVALQMATTHPEKVARLVMLTLPAARQEIGGQAAKIGAVVEGWFASPILVRSLFRFIRRPSLIRTVLLKLHQDPSRVDAALIESFVRPTQARGAARTFCYLVKSRTANDFCPQTRDLVPLLQAPTLLLWGTQDIVIPISWGRYVNTLSDRLTFVEIAGAGHFFYDERPDELHALLSRWMLGELPATNHPLNDTLAP